MKLISPFKASRRQLIASSGLLAAIGVVIVISTFAADSGLPADDPARGLIYADLQKATAPECAGQLELTTKIEGRTLCTHGPDPGPAGIDVRQPEAKNDEPSLQPSSVSVSTSFTGEALATTAAGAVGCLGDGHSGNRVQAVYFHASDRADRFEEYKVKFRVWLIGVNAMFRDAATETGGQRQVRFVTDADCNPEFLQIDALPGDDDNFNKVIGTMQRLGYTAKNRKYLIFLDANKFCGAATMHANDPRMGPENGSNLGPDYAMVDSRCWGSHDLAHELTHNLGGVQQAAPRGTSNGHCTDNNDIMCYADGSGEVLQSICRPKAYEVKLDCNKDDYFNVSPPSSSWLANHWNVANNLFLAHSNPPNSTPFGAFRRFNCDSIAGWTIDPDKPFFRSDIYLKIDGQTISTTKTDRYGAEQTAYHLDPNSNSEAPTMPDVPHSFDLPFPELLQNGIPHIVEVQTTDLDTGQIKSLKAGVIGPCYYYRPVADTEAVKAQPDSNFGTAPILNNDNGRISYLKFTVPPLPNGATVTSALLKLTPSSNYDHASFRLHATHSLWTETGLVWNNRPQSSGDILGVTTISGKAGAAQSFDVSAYVKAPGTYSFLGASYGRASFYSREGSYKPRLELEVKPPPPPPGQHQISAVAGGEYNGYFPPNCYNGVPPLSAWLDVARGVTIGPDGKLYFSVQNTQSCVYKVEGGALWRFASGSDFADRSPEGIAFDSGGNLYITAWDKVYKRSPAGQISHFAGNGTNSFSGDGGPATQAGIYGAEEAAADTAGNVYIVDFGNNRIRKVNTAGIISTFAGTGAEPFNGDNNRLLTNMKPAGLDFDDAGNLYVADSTNNRIRKISTSGQVTTVAGSGIRGFTGDGGPATSAKINDPRCVHVNHAGEIFICDNYNYRVRMVDRNGIIHTVVGNGLDCTGVDGPATATCVGWMGGIAVNAAGNLYLTGGQHNNGRVFKVTGFNP